ncbi:MAG: shikimate dehydrogenase [Aquificaceae bacterium]
MTISGKTEVYGILGYPVKHSLSPIFQNSAFEYLGIDAVYIPFEVRPEDLKHAIYGLSALSVRGVNVTLPHKEKVLEYVDRMDEHTAVIGSANTLKFTNVIEAYNTDWTGFLKALNEAKVEGKAVLVLGAGGTSKAILYALKRAEYDVYLWNRTYEKAVELSKKFQVQVVKKPEDVLKRISLIVNTTSVGLQSDDPPLFDYSQLDQGHTVFDVIYKETPLLRRAQEVGAKAIDGLSMLLYQGIESLKIWTGFDVPFEVVKNPVVNLRR